MEKELQQLLEKIIQQNQELLQRREAEMKSLAQLSESSSRAETDSAKLEETIRLKEADITALQEQVAELGSLEYQTAVIRDWAQALTPEAYLKLGEELGFDVSAPVAEAEVAEAAKGKPGVVYEDPHDPEYKAVPSLGLWVISGGSVTVAS